ncbi:hypothetical protein HMPREF0724_13429 [Prescottella equi ATCC 33707]|uniref:Uncharacterized protein n=1 Tax=Prescottella equi ATCC 33707 TaxID=525370 RepID=E9T4K9_RHOHA|nr:hypothetical protein HMPREF0724_13429 [Prescottella equi ATCC 33707]
MVFDRYSTVRHVVGGRVVGLASCRCASGGPVGFRRRGGARQAGVSWLLWL